MNMNDILETLSIARDAVEAAPSLHKQVERLETDLNEERQYHNITIGDLELAKKRIAELEEALSAAEVERDQHSFRADAAEKKLSRISTLVGNDVDHVEPSPTEVRPDATTTTPDVAPTPSQDTPLPVQDSPPIKPYAGRMYYEKPSDVSWVDWQAGGGSVSEVAAS